MKIYFFIFKIELNGKKFVAFINVLNFVLKLTVITIAEYFIIDLITVNHMRK